LYIIFIALRKHSTKSVGWKTRCFYEWWSYWKKWLCTNHDCKPIRDGTFICATKCRVDVNMAHVTSYILKFPLWSYLIYMLILSLMKQKNHNFFKNDFQSLNVNSHVGMELFVKTNTLKVGNANCGKKYYAITK
jgi:hypothetical protein